MALHLQSQHQQLPDPTRHEVSQQQRAPPQPPILIPQHTQQSHVPHPYLWLHPQQPPSTHSLLSQQDVRDTQAALPPSNFALQQQLGALSALIAQAAQTPTQASTPFALPFLQSTLQPSLQLDSSPQQESVDLNQQARRLSDLKRNFIDPHNLTHKEIGTVTIPRSTKVTSQQTSKTGTPTRERVLARTDVNAEKLDIAVNKQHGDVENLESTVKADEDNEKGETGNDLDFKDAVKEANESDESEGSEDGEDYGDDMQDNSDGKMQSPKADAGKSVGYYHCF